MQRKRSVAILTLFLCALLLLPPLPATALDEPNSWTLLAAESDTIIWGDVLDVAPHWNEAHNLIFSTVTIAVKHYLKGTGAGQVSFELAGGTAEDVTQWTSDTPSFALGEEVIVFLRPGAWPVTGGERGKLSVAGGLVYGAEVQPLVEFLDDLSSALARQGLKMPRVPLDALAPEVVNPAAAPVIIGLSQTQAPAGTGKVITIQGSNFGSTQGSSNVEFNANPGFVVADIVSWSNSQIRCEVPFMASSHATQGVRVNTAGGIGYAGFTITFSYSGAKWPGSLAQANYFINANASSCLGEALAVRKAGWFWNEVDYHNFAFKYWGTTSRSAPVQDTVNVVTWAAGQPSLITLYVWTDGSGAITEFDLVFDDDVSWSTAAICPADRYDVQNVAAFCFGRALGIWPLNGAPDAAKTMYNGLMQPGETFRRSLDVADQGGIKWIY